MYLTLVLITLEKMLNKALSNDNKICETGPFFKILSTQDQTVAHGYLHLDAIIYTYVFATYVTTTVCKAHVTLHGTVYRSV